MRQAGLLIFFGYTVMCAATVAAADGPWYFAIEGGLGRARQSFESPLGDHQSSPLTVFRGSVALGLRHKEHFSAEFEIAWLERGAQEVVRTVFYPDGVGTLRYERGYLDLAIPLACRLQHGRAYADGGVAPRVAILASEHTPFLSTLHARTFLFGMDPHLRVGYRGLYATARYMLDLSAPYDPSEDSGIVELEDELYFFGLGLAINL